MATHARRTHFSYLPRLAGPAALFAAALLTLAAQPAAADSHAMITAGLGSNLGFNQTTRLNGGTSTAFTTEFSLRVKALYALGFEFAYAPTDSHSSDELVYTNNLRLSGLVYFVPTPWVSAYFKGGIEGDGFGALFAYDDPASSYHAGGGIEVHIDDHWVVGVEFLVLLPGVTSVENTVERYVDQETARYQAALSAGETPAAIGADAPDPSDFLSANNFRLTFGARYFF